MLTQSECKHKHQWLLKGHYIDIYCSKLSEVVACKNDLLGFQSSLTPTVHRAIVVAAVSVPVSGSSSSR